jgi:hypothetical protein
MKKTILLICFLAIWLTSSDVNCQEPDNQESDRPDQTESVVKDEKIEEEKPDQSIWVKIWGGKARDALLLGMWTIHLDGTGEYFGDGRNNDQAHLLGAQYYGLTAGTFINSHDDRAWFFGLAREVYSNNFTEDVRLDIGYRFGLLYGYGDELRNVGGMSVYAVAIAGISWKRLGFDLGIVPVGVLTGSFRIDIDDLFN